MAVSFIGKESSKKSREHRQRGPQTPRPAITRGHIFKTGLFFGFAILLVLICFWGQFPFALEVLSNQVSKIRIVADHSFTYKSDLLTQRKASQISQQIAPVYQIDTSHYATFHDYIMSLIDQLDVLETEVAGLSNEKQKEKLDAFVQSFEQTTQIYLNPDDLVYILAKTDTSQRKLILEEGLNTLKDITREGILETEETAETSLPYLYSIQIEGRQEEKNIKTEKDALRYLSLNLVALDIEWPLARAFFRVLKHGIHPNLVFDANKTAAKKALAINAMEPVNATIAMGDTIIEPGSIIGPEQIEQLRAYRKFLRENEDLGFGFNVTLRERTLLTLIILFVAVLYIKVGMPEILHSRRRLTLCAVIIPTNLLVIRIILEAGNFDFLEAAPNLLSILPFLCPFALGPMLATILMGPRHATIIAALVSTFYALMLGSVTSFLLIALISSLIGIYFCKEIRLRNHVVRAAAFTGLITAFCALIMGSFNEVPFHTLIYQVIFALLTGIISGILAISLLPILEKFFRLTTDITLLELTDYNHPLLRRLQLEAPGTYHHSLMVANLAERAAAEIHANYLICRTGSLYHDIGKLVKPEYFGENQTPGMNPHYDRNPSISALIIKSHVKEGLVYAKKYKLPHVIMDIIEQHHGTTLIHYFFDKAVKQKAQTELPLSDELTPTDEDADVDESTFRYDGPKPQFKESAIIFFADSLEAASRALAKPSASNIEELVNKIFQEKLEDQQLDECPLTMKEMRLIKKSFTRTLLNMLHARVQYPDKEGSLKPVTTTPTLPEHETNT